MHVVTLYFLGPSDSERIQGFLSVTFDMAAIFFKRGARVSTSTAGR